MKNVGVMRDFSRQWGTKRKRTFTIGLLRKENRTLARRSSKRVNGGTRKNSLILEYLIAGRIEMNLSVIKFGYCHGGNHPDVARRIVRVSGKKFQVSSCEECLGEVPGKELVKALDWQMSRRKGLFWFFC